MYQKDIPNILSFLHCIICSNSYDLIMIEAFFLKISGMHVLLHTLTTRALIIVNFYVHLMHIVSNIGSSCNLHEYIDSAHIVNRLYLRNSGWNRYGTTLVFHKPIVLDIATFVWKSVIQVLTQATVRHFEVICHINTRAPLMFVHDYH